MKIGREIYEVISFCNKIAVLIIPIITVLGLIIPKTRNALTNFFRKISGYDSVIKTTEDMQEHLKKMSSKLEELDKQLKTHLDLDEKKTRAQMNDLKDSLLRAFHFYLDRGFITLEELSVLQDMFDSYTELGGNGVIKAKWENEILKLPSSLQE